MNLFPKLNDIKKIAFTGQYDILPVSCELLSDFTTPVEAMRILKQVSSHCYLLESARADEAWGRYSYLGFDPKLEITCKNGSVTLEHIRCDSTVPPEGSCGDGTAKPEYAGGDTGKPEHAGRIQLDTDDPSACIREILSRYRSPRLSCLPPFTGGLVGYFAYDYLVYREPLARSGQEDTGSFNDMDLMLYDQVIAFDHLQQKLILMVNMSLKDPEKEYRQAAARLAALAGLLRSGKKTEEPGGALLGPITPLFNREQFCSMVEQAKHFIREGDIFQIVLSNCLSAPFEGSLFNTYRMLRTLNPSPYMFYFSGRELEMAGASPETLVKLENGILHTFPLAGTRKRSRQETENRALEAELLADEKELAEHNMLVDLGRNDLGKISRFGTVQVEKLRFIEHFSHVMHIGSSVRGEIRDGQDALDAIEAVLPAGTLSGAPKIRACQLIGALENNPRGIYGGAIGYIDFTGNMDTCIAIRFACRKNGRILVQSGAGIVADSVPEKEFEECLNKARAVIRALELAQEDTI